MTDRQTKDRETDGRIRARTGAITDGRRTRRRAMDAHAHTETGDGRARAHTADIAEFEL